MVFITYLVVFTDSLYIYKLSSFLGKVQGFHNFFCGSVRVSIISEVLYKGWVCGTVFTRPVIFFVSFRERTSRFVRCTFSHSMGMTAGRGQPTQTWKLESNQLPYNVKNVLEMGQTDKWGLGFFRKTNIQIFGGIKLKFNILERVLHQQVDVIHSANSLCQEQRPSISLLRTDVISRGGTRKQTVKEYE